MAGAAGFVGGPTDIHSSLRIFSSSRMPNALMWRASLEKTPGAATRRLGLRCCLRPRIKILQRPG
jgi:hypothetical protein